MKHNQEERNRERVKMLREMRQKAQAPEPKTHLVVNMSQRNATKSRNAKITTQTKTYSGSKDTPTSDSHGVLINALGAEPSRMGFRGRKLKNDSGHFRNSRVQRGEVS